MKYLFPFLIVAFLLSGCRSHSDVPVLSASGYLADQGMVRLWRKNSTPQSLHLMTVYTPFTGTTTETTDYQWLDGKLRAVSRHFSGEQLGDINLRFDSEGHANFMQRQRAGYKEALSAEDIALYQFDAQRMREISDDLLRGEVRLLQGHWFADGKVVDCQGMEHYPEFSLREKAYLQQQQTAASATLNIAWLETTTDRQLLLAGAADLCLDAPNEAEF